MTRQLAGDVVAGRLPDITAGSDWPHADTADAMAMALERDAGPSWVITIDGVIIGDCGAFSWPDDKGGVVEIGYGIAESFRGNGYAAEATEGMCGWLFAEAGAAAITATGVGAANLASRRVLEKLRFTLIDADDRHVSYRLERSTDGTAPLGLPCGPSDQAAP